MATRNGLFKWGISWAMLIFSVLFPLSAEEKTWRCRDCNQAGIDCQGQDTCNGLVQDCFGCNYKCGNLEGGQLVFGDLIECELQQPR